MVVIEVGPQERVQQRTVEQIGNVPVPQIQEQIEEVVVVIPKERFLLVCALWDLSQTRVSLRLVSKVPFTVSPTTSLS